MQKRTVIEIGLCMLMGVILWYGICVLRGDSYYAVSLAIILTGLIGFFLLFENGKPGVALLTVMAALCGVAIVSRIAFFFLPQVKPMAAIVIIAGIVMGREVGFMTGAVSAFVSNFYFGQGSWTPFQMFALGLIGYLAGVFFVRGGNKWLVSLYGFFSVIIIYGGIVDLNTLYFVSQKPNLAIILAVYAKGLPFNFIFGISTAAFLFLLYHPLLKKLNRLQKKYRIIDK